MQAIWENEYRGTLLDAAVVCALKEWSVSEVGKPLSLSTSRVYLTKHRIASAVRKEVKRLEKEFEKHATRSTKPAVTKSDTAILVADF